MLAFVFSFLCNVVLSIVVVFVFLVAVVKVCGSPRPDTYQTLTNAKKTDDFSPYQSSPHISESVWSAIGNHLSSHERSYTTVQIPNTSAITLRLHVANYGKSLLIANYNFDVILETMAKDLTEHFRATYTYVSQNEIVTVIPPSQVNHLYGGCRDDFISNAIALTVSGMMPSVVRDDSRGYTHPSITCKVGVWQSEKEAFQLILSRSYVAMRRAVDDCLPKGHTLVGLEQLKWCHENHCFPSPSKAYGTLIKSQVVMVKGVNVKTSLPFEVPRRRLVISQDNLLNTYKQHTGF
jgi:hypothetical protein